MKKIINEQISINDALTTGCFSKEKYPWFVMDNDTQPKKTQAGTLVVTGKNSKGEKVYFYEMESGKDFGIYKNIETGNFKQWTCEKVDLKPKEEEKPKPLTGCDKNVPEIESMLNNSGWSLTEPPITSPEYDMGMDIRNIMGGKYDNCYQTLKNLGKSTIAYPQATVNKLDDWSSGIDDSKKFKQLSDEGKLSKKDCKNWIKGLSTAKKNNTQMNDTQLMQAKTKVYACYKQDTKFSQGSFGIGDELKDLVGDVGKYGIGDLVRGSGAKMNESMKHDIKSIIKENLIISAKKKENKLLSENTIINSRLKLLSEGVNVKNKKEVEKFFDLVITETAYLHSQNYDKTLIKESFMDLLRGLFGNASTSVFQYFQEHIARWFVEKFTPINPNSWMGNIIITSIGNVPLTELSNLTNCSYTSKLLAKGVAEGAINKIKNEQGLTGPGYDILRNALIEMAEDSTFGQKVEQKISEYICPKLQGLKGKLEGVTGKIKSNALGLSDKTKELADKGKKALQSKVALTS